MALLRSGIEFILLDDMIKAGDADRMTICVKRLLPTFIGISSYRSKYALECVNFLTKTEILLNQQNADRIKLQAFVNNKGEPGHNKAADMQQENNIKAVKTVIKGLGAGKSDKAMLRVSKAAPVVASISDNLERSLGIDPPSQKNRTGKNLEDDHSNLHVSLRIIRPFRLVPGRNLAQINMAPSVLSGLDSYKIKEFIERHRDRAINRIEGLEFEENEEAEDQ